MYPLHPELMPVIVLVVLIATAVLAAVVCVKLVAFVFRSFVSVGSAVVSPLFRPIGRQPQPSGSDRKLCASDQCRFANKPGARYCAMCGRPLT